jgi:hypothetical protein
VVLPYGDLAGLWPRRGDGNRTAPAASSGLGACEGGGEGWTMEYWTRGVDGGDSDAAGARGAGAQRNDSDAFDVPVGGPPAPVGSVPPALLDRLSGFVVPAARRCQCPSTASRAFLDRL